MVSAPRCCSCRLHFIVIVVAVATVLQLPLHTNALAGVRYVRIQTTGSEYMLLNEVRVMACSSPDTNIALSKSVTSSTATGTGGCTVNPAAIAVDGTTTCPSGPLEVDLADVFCSNIGDAYWQVDLGAAYDVCSITLQRRYSNAWTYTAVLKGTNSATILTFALPASDATIVTCTTSSCSTKASTCAPSAQCTSADDCNGRATSVSGNRPSCSCTCSSAWTGTSCQTSNVCTNADDCNGRATSVSGNRPSCSCTCSSAWTGTSCQTSNVCTTAADCSDHATSVSGNRPSCSCTCDVGYIGATCATRICALGPDCNATHTVSVHGVFPGCWCVCHRGYGGASCGRLLTDSATMSTSISSTARRSGTLGSLSLKWTATPSMSYETPVRTMSITPSGLPTATVSSAVSPSASLCMSSSTSWSTSPSMKLSASDSDTQPRTFTNSISMSETGKTAGRTMSITPSSLATPTLSPTAASSASLMLSPTTSTTASRTINVSSSRSGTRSRSNTTTFTLSSTRSVGSRSMTFTHSVVTENVTLTLSCPGPVRAMLLAPSEEANRTTDRCAATEVRTAAAAMLLATIERQRRLMGSGSGADNNTTAPSAVNASSLSIPCAVLYASERGGQAVAVASMPTAFPALFVLPYAVDVNWNVAAPSNGSSLTTASATPHHALIPDTSAVGGGALGGADDVVEATGRVRGSLVWFFERAPGDEGGETTVATVLCTCGMQQMHTTFELRWPRRTISTATEVITGLVAVAGPFSSDPSSAAALAMVNLLSCSSRTSALASSGYVISVFFAYGPAAIALGNLGLICTVALLGFASVRCLVATRCCSLRATTTTTQGAMALLRFPSIPLTVAEFLLPGAVFGISAGMASGEAVAASIVALLGVCGVLLCGQYLLHRVVLPAAHCEPYALPYPTGHAMEQRLLFPSMRWMPRAVVQPYLPLMNSMQQRYAPMKVCDLLLSLSLSVATGVGVGSDGASCSIAPVVVTTIYLAYAVVLTVLRPRRLPMDRVFCPSIVAAFGVICALKYVGGSRSDAIASNLQLLLGALQMSQTACTLYVRFRERQWHLLLSKDQSAPSLAFLALEVDSYALPLSEGIAPQQPLSVLHLSSSMTELNKFGPSEVVEDDIDLERYWNPDGTAVARHCDDNVELLSSTENVLPLSYLLPDATRRCGDNDRDPSWADTEDVTL